MDIIRGNIFAVTDKSIGNLKKLISVFIICKILSVACVQSVCALLIYFFNIISTGVVKSLNKNNRVRIQSLDFFDNRAAAIESNRL